MRTHSQETQDSLTPDCALEILKEGNARFVNNLRANRNFLQQVNETRDGQFPFAAILSCMDSRTSAELIFDQGLGDIFSIRVAGNVLNTDILGSVEYAMKAAGSKILIVLGHTKCGAVIGACNKVELGSLTSLLEKIRISIEKEEQTKENRTGGNLEFVNHVAELNVNHTIQEIINRSPVINELLKENKIKIVGAMHDIETGKVAFFD